MATGFSKLDRWLDGGFFRKELIIVGGHTGIGKSYIAGQLMYNIANQGFKCGYFSLEISNEMIVSRMTGALSNLKPTKIRMGNLTTVDIMAKQTAEANLLALGDFLYFNDTVNQLEEIVQRIKKDAYDFVVIDFIQNIITSDKEEYSRMSNAALTLQNTAKEANCTILALSQVSNAVAREAKNSDILEYKGSGSIATVCDLGFFIQRGEAIWDTVSDNPLLLSLRKNRRGASGLKFDLFFKNPGGKIYEP